MATHTNPANTRIGRSPLGGHCWSGYPNTDLSIDSVSKTL